MATTNSSTQTNPTDDMISRKSTGRFISTFLSPITSLVLGYWLGTSTFELLNFSKSIGGILGLGLGFWFAVTVVERSFIKNGAVQAFVTINPLASLFGSGNALVSYGPGSHFCYWWETRSGSNNVNLSAVAEPISAIVQCVNGTLTMAGDFRLRPDIANLPKFLSGVGTVAGDLSSLIEAEIVGYLKNKEVSDALKDLVGLNVHLKTTFVYGTGQQNAVTELERNYGLVIADVTISKMLPSKEVQETMGAINEARIIAEAVRDFICSTKGIPKSEYDAAVKSKDITPAEINDTRDRIMAMSNNLQGMNLSRTQLDINVNGLGDLPKDSVAALAVAAQALAAMRGKQPTKRSGT